MWVSLQVLVAITLILSGLLYIVEHNAQPDVFSNYWDALLWSFMGYIDDPGEFATYAPITFWGRVLKIMCALVNIAIFAVPAGLVAGGFSDAIAEDKREKELESLKDKISGSFRRVQDKATKFRTVPRYVSLVDIQVLQQIDTKDIIDAVRTSSDFRLRNLASAIPASNNPSDRLVIEAIPAECRTAYGCCIDRGSRVTIVAPSAAQEVGMGNFAYYLALFGGFNYISKEYDAAAGDVKSYYLVDDDMLQSTYMADVKRLSQGSDRWTIALIAADSVHPEGLHFITATNEKAGGKPAVINAEAFDKMYDAVSHLMRKDFDIDSELDTRYLPAGTKNLAVRIGGGKDCNAFTLRVDWSIAAFDNRHIAIAYALACEIAKTLENKSIEPEPDWKQPGYGYQH